MFNIFISRLFEKFTVLAIIAAHFVSGPFSIVYHEVKVKELEAHFVNYVKQSDENSKRDIINSFSKTTCTS